MPSESVIGFLDNAQASRVLFPEQVEQLIRAPDLPQSGLSSLCDYLHRRGVLTRYQAAALREGRGDVLSYAGYPVIDELGPCPGGTAYQVLHPSLRTPLVLRRVRADWLAPDTAAEYVARARAVGMLPHPNIVPLLDAGVNGDEAYLVIDQPPDAADLETLAGEVGGAMPGFLAAEYGRAVASVLRMAHERGGVHGDVRPGNVLVGPLVVKTGEDGQVRRRPAPDAVVRLAELGLVPLRPPEGEATPRGDIHGLGATLYFLLTGRPPSPAPLASLRPDLPEDFVTLIESMLDPNPDHRPHTAADVESALVPFCRPGTVPAQLLAPGGSSASGILIHPVEDATTQPAAPEPFDGWGVGHDAFSYTRSAAPAPRKRAISEQEKGRTRMLLILGGLLHLTAVVLLLAWVFGAFSSAPEPDTPPSKPAKPPPAKQKPKPPA